MSNTMKMRTKKQRSWSDTDIQTLIKMLSEKRSYKVIAQSLNRSIGAISVYASSHGFTSSTRHKGWNDNDRVLKPEKISTKKSTIKMRPCLRCRHDFRSIDAGDRIFDKCRVNYKRDSIGLAPHYIGMM